MRWSQLPLELADHIFAQLGLLELSRVVAVSRFCHSRLPAAITACSLRLRLGGYATANGLKSTSKLLAHLDTALGRAHVEGVHTAFISPWARGPCACTSTQVGSQRFRGGREGRTAARAVQPTSCHRGGS